MSRKIKPFIQISNIYQRNGKYRKQKKLRWDRILLITLALIFILLIINFITHNVSKLHKLENELDSKNKTIKQHSEQLNTVVNSLQTEIDNLNNQITTINTNIESTNIKVDTINNEVQAKINTVTSRSQTSSRASTLQNQLSSGEYIAFEATGYCNCSKCCGKTNGITASGTQATAGRTVAMSSKYSFGTSIEIQGMGTYIVEDRGGAIQGNKIDIYFSSHQEALNFGRRTVYIKIL